MVPAHTLLYKQANAIQNQELIYCQSFYAISRCFPLHHAISPLNFRSNFHAKWFPAIKNFRWIIIRTPCSYKSKWWAIHRIANTIHMFYEWNYLLSYVCWVIILLFYFPMLGFRSYIRTKIIFIA